MTIFLISNMYPSKKDPYYGSFIKVFYDSLNKKGYNLKINALIYGRAKNRFLKVWKYIVFFFEIFFKGIFCQYDIVYVHTVSHTAIPLLILGWFKKYTLVINPHGGDIIAINEFEKRMRFFIKKLVKKSQLIVVPSYFFKDYMLKEFNMNEEKIFVSASGGIDTGKFSVENRFLEKKAKETFEIGYVSRIDKGKGWDLLIKAIKKIVDENLIPNINCTIVGNGNEVEQMCALINELELVTHINYSGPKSHEELPNVYVNFDVFIFPTQLIESLGLVGLEAMSCGVPVIGTRIGGIKDYLVDNYNGYFFEPGDIAGLVNKIITFYKLNNNLKYLLGYNARDTALKYDIEKIVGILSDKLQEEFINIRDEKQAKIQLKSIDVKKK